MGWLKSKWRQYQAWWANKPEQEQRRLKSFLPWILYAGFVLYGVIYLSILNSVNRYRTGTTVKSWWGGDAPQIIDMKEKQAKEIEASFKGLRKRVSGNR